MSVSQVDKKLNSSDQMDDYSFDVTGVPPFDTHYYISCIRHLLKNVDYYQNLPRSHDHCVEIVPGLYLGSHTHACDRELLKKLQINVIYNVTYELKDPFIDDNQLRYHRIPVIDDHDPKSYDIMSKHLEEACSTIDKYLSSGHHVLVHCAAGV